MKKLLYISFLDEGKLSGYKKKIHSQCKAFVNLGVNVNLVIMNKGKIRNYEFKKTSVVDYTEIDLKFRRLRDERNLFDELKSFRLLCKYVIEWSKLNKPNIAYVRRIIPITPYLLRLIIKLKSLKMKVYYEYPTFPWENEMLSDGQRLFYFIDKFQFPILKFLVDNLVLVGTSEEYSNKKNIVISNAITVNDFKLRNSNRNVNNLTSNIETINLIGVANVNKFHGYDRLIDGLSKYYNVERNIVVNFNIVGNVPSNLKLEEKVVMLGLSKYVTFKGLCNGEELDDLFDTNDIGVGCLGVHRKNISKLNSLKNREYAARGLPFFYSEIDNGFEPEFPWFIMKVEPGEEYINIEKIVDFFSKTHLKNPEEIREYARKNLDWESQMIKIIRKYEEDRNGML